MFEVLTSFIASCFPGQTTIPLHEPRFVGNERAYLLETIDSTFVSSVGKFVDRFERLVAEYTGAGYAIATVNGTAALHVALLLGGVRPGEEVITQPLTFVATCNAIRYCGAEPVFVDVDRDTLGLSPQSLRSWLEQSVVVRDGLAVNRGSGRVVRACVPVHVFGHPCRIDEIASICCEFGIALIEDATESLGSDYKGRPTGTFGRFGVFSFNGNKIITTGGGGMILCDDPELAKRAKHLTTTAKVSHPWVYSHDEIGFNYRLPNLNAALGCAQMEQLTMFVKQKRDLAEKYLEFGAQHGLRMIHEPAHSRSNYWLNAIQLSSLSERESFLAYAHARSIQVRPVWTLMNELPMFRDAVCGPLDNARFLAERLVNLPSSVIIHDA